MDTGVLDSKFRVNEEYMEAFRSKSYLDMFNKVQGQLKKSRGNDNSGKMCSNHLSEFLLEPQQKWVADMLQGSSRSPQLLLDYFEASWHASTVCESLLRSIHQARANHTKVKRVVSLSKSAGAEHANSVANDMESQQQRVWRRAKLLGELNSYASLKNPFGAVSPAQFREIHDRHKALFRRLKSRSRMMKRRAKIGRLCKDAAGFGLVVSYTAIATALMVLAVHSIVGVLAAPGAVGCSSWVMRTVKRVRVTGGRRKRPSAGRHTKRRKPGETGAAHQQLDVAGKGMYIMINDLDTMSRLVRRLHDQVEHGKAIADICVRSGRGEVLREVVKELEAQERCYLEQLEELEDHIYLCFLNINRSRSLLIQEIRVVNHDSANTPTTDQNTTTTPSQ